MEFVAFQFMLSGGGAGGGGGGGGRGLFSCEQFYYNSLKCVQLVKLIAKRERGWRGGGGGRGGKNKQKIGNLLT